MKKKKKKINMKKVVLVILVIIVAIFGLIVVKDKLFGGKEVQKETKVVDKLDKYGYELNDNETKYYNDLFKKLKTVLNKDKVNEEEYAKLISQLFLADYFNLDNKISKNDVGGVQFVYKDYQTSFTKKSTDEVYKYVESNIYKNRNQELPIVTNVEVTDITKGSFDYLDKTDDDAYTVELKVSYKKDLGYQKNVTLVLIHSGIKLEIAKMS